MKNKKLPIIIGLVLCVVVLVVVLVLLLFNNPKITITFNEDGGETIAPLVVKKGENVELPDAKKEGYIFEGWYHNEQKVANPASFEENATLVAHYIAEAAKTMTITFDTTGGKKIEPMTIECDPVLNLPKPTKTGYKFLQWQDKNEIMITNETKLVCEDLTLYAKWEKEAEKKSSSSKPSSAPPSSAPPSSSAKKEYTCPSGYTLNGTKCTKETAYKTRCTGERVFEYGDQCVKINGTVRQNYEKACSKVHITYMSFAGYVEGEVGDWGIKGCAYYKTNDTTKDACESHGFKWVTPKNACYVKWDTSTVINSCNTGYANITNPNAYEGVNGLNSGCFPVSAKEKYCDEGTLSNNKCVQTIEATLK